MLYLFKITSKQYLRLNLFSWRGWKKINFFIYFLLQTKSIKKERINLYINIKTVNYVTLKFYSVEIRTEFVTLKQMCV